MALIAALLPSSDDRAALDAAAAPHEVVRTDSWRDLDQVVRERPIAAAVADLHVEKRKDGVLRVYRFAERYPLTPLIAWGDVDGRALFRLGKAGAAEVVAAHDTGDRVLVGELLTSTLQDRLGTLVDTHLHGRVGEDGRAFVRHAAERIPERIQVPDVAEALGVSVSTLGRRCERWGLPTPGRLLLWLRTLYGVRRLLEPGRSVESVAEQLGYSSGAAFRRAIKATVGGRPSPLRNERGLERTLATFLEECPGERARKRLSAIG